jgi:hypothetical protein
LRWDRQQFRAAYVAAGGSSASANSYVSYLNRVERLVGDLTPAIVGSSLNDVLARLEDLPASSFDGERNRRDSLSALRKLIELQPVLSKLAAPSPRFAGGEKDVRALLREAKLLAARYYCLTGKPLGVTGEVAELEAADKLGLRLEQARSAGFDALAQRDGKLVRVQIKGRAVASDDRYRGTCPSIKCGNQFDVVLLVLLDRATLDALEIWEALEIAVMDRLAGVSEAKQNRNALAITQFKSIATKVWPV